MKGAIVYCNDPKQQERAVALWAVATGNGNVNSTFAMPSAI